jgi:hypothetical protein
MNVAMRGTVLFLGKITTALSIVAFAFLGAHAEELTGIVKQPTKPYDPAVDSTVTVYAKDGQTKLVPSDTTDATGHYHFQIEKGKEVIVQATWRSSSSSPGRTQAIVKADPTVADVQLLPPITAPADAWFQVGPQWVKTSGSVIALNNLRESGISAPSMFQFIQGVRMQAKGALPELSKQTIFNSESIETITSALQQAESQLKENGNVPSREDLVVDFRTQLTDREFAEILGFIAPQPNDSEKYKQWEAAIAGVSGSKLKEQVINEKDFFQDFFKPASGQRASLETVNREVLRITADD